MASSVCRSLQCLISALTQGWGGGHFFRLTCSVLLWGGRNTANNTGLCSQCLHHTGFAPIHGVCAFPVYTAQALGCSAGNCLRRALGCMHFPGGSLCFSFFCLLVSSVSTFRPDTRGRWWTLFKARLFSSAVGREEYSKEITLACARSVSATLGLPLLTVCAFPVYTA